MTPHLSTSDWAHIRRAVDLGKQGWGKVHPNPMVGCVLVKDGEVVAEGWHQELGGPHAEAHALKSAGEGARGATAYVSLEPCDHVGRTPACSKALVEAGIFRVVYGASDPGLDSGGGAETLRSHGVAVTGPVFPLETAKKENPAFFHNHLQGATYVALKLAQTLDGRIAEAPGRRTRITGAEARKETHRLRAGFDGVLVGSETMLVDDPLLTVREGVPTRAQPSRVILDSSAKTPPGAKVFDDVSDAPVLIFTAEDAPVAPVRRLEEVGATVHRVPRGLGGVSIEEVLAVCWEAGIRSLFCEGGGRVASRLIQGHLAQRLYLFVAPFVLGDKGVSAFPGLESSEAWNAWKPMGPARTFGNDVLLTFDRTE